MKHILLPSLVLVLPLAACSTPGRCIGVPNMGKAATTDQKVLINIDKDGLALQGYDPVAYFTEKKPVPGDAALTSTHGGGVYRFSTAQHKATFDAAPDKYAPLFGGYCAYAASINTISPISPEQWEIVDGRLILQHNQRAWDAWHKDAANNLVKADKNWPGIVEHNGTPPRTLVNIDAAGVALQGYDPTAYFIDSKPRKGDPALARTYQGATYYFTDADHKNAFEKDPTKYLPQFGGFCGYAASINKVSPVNPEIWQLVDGKLVLQHTPKAFKLFNENVADNNAKAQKFWPGLSRRRCG